MRLRRCRLRSLMMTMAGITVLLGLGIRSAHLRERAKYHHDLDLFHSVLADLTTGHCGNVAGTDELLTIELTAEGASLRPASAEAEKILKSLATQRAAGKRLNENLSAYHARCAHRFEQAALIPWLPVSIDPPPPEPE
jgi:hypothetical protein